MMWALLLGCHADPPALVPVEHTTVAPPAAAPATPVPAAPDADPMAITLTTPKGTFVDQDGKTVVLADLLAGDTPTAIQFIFTTCPMTCPLLGAGFASLQAVAPGTRLVSITIDPATDTPAALTAWGARFGRKPGWTLLTGSRADVDTILKAWGVYTPIIGEHTPLILLGRKDTWYRVNGLAASEQLAALLTRLEVPPNDGAQAWFTDTPLVDEHGNRWRFYSDLVHGRSVVINGFYSHCKGSCPAVNGNLQALAQVLGDRVGRDVEILSISIDPEADTPDELLHYAAGFGAHPGWHFLTGPRADVEAVLKKLGLYTEDRESHSPLVLIGNDRTGLWKKALGFSPPEELAATVRSVIDDRGAP
jgi:cytochrome oxidase Cu insertion factor (SCO1/SenC/PrrC family)